MYELKIRTNEKLVSIIKILAKERGVSINKMCIKLLEIGIYKIFERESKNEK